MTTYQVRAREVTGKDKGKFFLSQEEFECETCAINCALNYLFMTDEDTGEKWIDWVTVSIKDAPDPLDAIVFQAGTTFG